jgi:hypothetical protein
MRKFMRGLLSSLVLAACLALPPSAGAQPPEEPKKVEREGSTQVVHYALAGIAVLAVLLLICVPARRN